MLASLSYLLNFYEEGQSVELALEQVYSETLQRTQSAFRVCSFSATAFFRVYSFCTLVTHDGHLGCLAGLFAGVFLLLLGYLLDLRFVYFFDVNPYYDNLNWLLCADLI